MSGRGCRVLPAIAVFLFFFCMCQALLQGVKGYGVSTVHTLQLEEPYSAEMTAEIPKQGDSGGFSFWGQQPAAVKSRSLNRTVKAVLVTVWGNSRLVLESSRMLEAGEQGTCLMSRKLALALFGTGEASGQEIEIGQASYRVAGILYCEEEAVLVQADPAPGGYKNMDKIALEEAAGESIQESIRRFTSRTGITADRLPLYLYQAGADLAAHLVPCLVYFSLFGQFLKKGKGCKTGMLFCMWVLAGLAGTVLGIWILGLDFEIPREMLPSMWSDFDFWGELWEQKKRGFLTLVMAEKNLISMCGLRNFITAVGYSILAAVLGHYAFKRLEIKRGKTLLGMTMGALLFSFFFLVLHREDGAKLLGEPIMWLFLPACLGMRYVSRKR